MPADAPACVQNAMMTKDKKPFTYTPGGIDLSQIKSPRMAMRVAKNAQSEGVQGPPKQLHPAQVSQPQTTKCHSFHFQSSTRFFTGVTSNQSRPITGRHGQVCWWYAVSSAATTATTQASARPKWVKCPTTSKTTTAKFRAASDGPPSRNKDSPKSYGQSAGGAQAENQ